MLRRFLLVAGLLLIGAPAVVNAATSAPPRATGVSVNLNLAEYQLPGAPFRRFECGRSYVTRTWIVSKAVASANSPGVANISVNVFYGDEHLTGNQTRQPKFDRIGVKDYPLVPRPVQFGDFDWFNQPDDRGEPYVWQFDVRAEGQLLNTCEITVTRA